MAESQECIVLGCGRARWGEDVRCMLHSKRRSEKEDIARMDAARVKQRPDPRIDDRQIRSASYVPGRGE